MMNYFQMKTFSKQKFQKDFKMTNYNKIINNYLKIANQKI